MIGITYSNTSCGRCGRSCAGPSTGGNGTPSCRSGRCVIACESGFSDCDGNPANGCEVDTRTSDAHCGLCGNSCGGAGCVNGACTCAGTSVAGKSAPLDLFFLVDRSGSMIWDMDETADGGAGGRSTSGGQVAPKVDVSRQRWASIRAALKSFLVDPQAAGMGVALVRLRLGAPWLENGTLVRPFARSVPSPHAHYLCWRTGTMDRWECTAFADWLKQALT